jgi:hypothetical protein
MSNTDSFVDEVTDAVRRDRLFAAFRKYGWIGVLLVVLIVGGAAWNEWQKAQAAARAEAFGDAALAALEKPDAATRATALAAIPADAEQKATQALLISGNPEGDKAASLAALDALIADGAQPEVYRDLAVLRRVALAGPAQPLADRRAALEGVAIPGRPFRTLAEEQLAYLLIEEGQKEAALTALLALVQDQEAPVAMRQRLGQVIMALGGVVPEQVAPVAPAEAG